MVYYFLQKLQTLPARLSFHGICVWKYQITKISTGFKITNRNNITVFRAGCDFFLARKALKIGIALPSRMIIDILTAPNQNNPLQHPVRSWKRWQDLFFHTVLKSLSGKIYQLPFPWEKVNEKRKGSETTKTTNSFRIGTNFFYRRKQKRILRFS